MDSIIVVLKICQRLGSWGRSLRQLVGKGTHSSEGNQSLVMLGTGVLKRWFNEKGLSRANCVEDGLSSSALLPVRSLPT